MNKFTIILLSSVLSFSLTAQVWENNLLKINSNPTATEKFEAFENYRATHPYTKGNGYNPYSRKMDFILERTSENNTFNPNAVYIEWKKEQEKYTNSKISSSANWVAKGPINTPITLNSTQKRGNGRVNCIAFDPIDANIIWIGSPSGGLWKSIDGGSNWTTNTDDLPVIGVSHIAINPNNNQIMYIVTGDDDANDTYSIGILKSIDGGSTWNTTGLSYAVDQEITVNKVIINPNFTDSLYAVTNSNIQISADAGVTWQAVANGRFRDIEFKPNNSNVIYAAKHSSNGSNIYRSIDGGANWSVINNGVSGDRNRPLIAVTPDNPEVVYALFSASDDGFSRLYKSSDAGDSWVMKSSSPNILAWDIWGSGSGGQSWYDLSLGVATNNEDLVYVGGVNIWRSDNSGINWDIDAGSGWGGAGAPSFSYMHVDQHAFEFNPHTHVAYAGNDGGVYKYMDNLNNWIDISDGLEISQFYRLGLSQSNTERLVAGAQDNGTEMLTNGIWDAIRGSDGMECAIDPEDEDVIYSTSQNGGLRKTDNGGNNWYNIQPVSYEGAWVTPWKIHPNNKHLIVAGYDEIYRSIDGGSAWDSISYNVSNGDEVKIIALAATNEEYVYAGTYSRLKVTKNTGATWENIKPGLPNYNITDVVVATNDPDKVWVTFSGYNNTDKVYETNDAGNSWVNISGNNLPGLPVNCIVHEGGTDNALYIGTDLGVYYKNNNTTEWVSFNDGLPNVIVKELEIHYTKGTISAATYGRGVWESPLNTPSTNLNNIESSPFSVYPNPANNQITINTVHQDILVIIYNLTGQKLIEKTTKRINTSGLSKGCYVIEVISSGTIKRGKLIIE